MEVGEAQALIRNWVGYNGFLLIELNGIGLF